MGRPLRFGSSFDILGLLLAGMPKVTTNTSCSSVFGKSKAELNMFSSAGWDMRSRGCCLDDCSVFWVGLWL